MRIILICLTCLVMSSLPAGATEDRARAIIDEMEQLGIYECDEEDVALCSFVCPSKSDLGAIIRKGLDTIYFDK